MSKYMEAGQEVISVSYNSGKIIHIFISNFINKLDGMEKFEEENKDNDEIFSLCGEDYYVNEASLNCFVEDLFFQYKIKKVKAIFIS